MTDGLDAETLAAYLDDQLTGAEREAVERVLTRDPGARELLRDVAAVMSESRPKRGRRIAGSGWGGGRFGWRHVAILVPAAAILILIVIPQLRRTSLTARAQLLSMNLSAVAERNGTTAALHEAVHGPSWPTSRAGRSELDVEPRSFRVGVQLVDLRVSMESAYEDGVRESAAAVESLLTGLPGGGPAATRIASLSSSSGAAGALAVDSIAELVRSLAGDTTYFDLGGWAETVRLTAIAGDDPGVYVATGAELNRLLRALANRSGERAAAVQLAAAPLQTLLRLRAPSDLRELRTALDSLIRTAAR